MDPKVAVLLLTCGRAEMTKEVWPSNLARAGYPYTLFWFDNGSTSAEYSDILEMAVDMPIEWFYYSKQNMGIAIALNRMIEAAFRRGFDMVISMANDIIEPDNWLSRRIEAAQAIPNTGIVSIPVKSAHMYQERNVNGIQINEGGQLIGNFLLTRAAYDKVGLYCTQYGIYGPIDLDYCDRCKAAGLRYYYIAGPMADHLGTVDTNPVEYQSMKKESLAKSWQQYTFNTHRYADGEGVYQFDLGPGEPAPGGGGSL